MDMIKYLDLFNAKFTFYANNQPNNQSIFGGIMTSIYILICLIIFILFSIDDLKRLNPIATMSEISYSERKLINMKKEKIWIPFRMVNYENQFIDHRGILYVVPYLIEGRINAANGMDLNYTLLNYKLCNETDMANRPENHLINLPLNQLFCIENDFLFGGNWNNDFLNYIEINLYLCEDGVAYNTSDPRCSKITDYLKNFNSSLLFDFHFPMVQFQPTNFETPIEIIYKNYYYRLSSYNYKIEKLYIKENILSDDINILRNNYQNKSCWGMSTLYSDDYYLPTEYDPISDNSNTSRIYALNIYMDDGIVFYTRTYKKLFLIISNVFPVFRVILFFFKKLTQNIKKSLTKIDILELFFENKDIKPRKQKHFKNLEDISKIKLNNYISLMPNKTEFELIKDNVNINEKNLGLKDINLNNSKKFLSDKNNNFFAINADNCNNIIDNNNNINDSFQKKAYLRERSTTDNIKILQDFKNNPLTQKKNSNKEKNYIFPKYYYFLDIIFDNLINPKKFFCISKTYFIIYNYMCKLYDITTYIILVKHFYIINNMLKDYPLKDKDLFLSKMNKKINIGDVNIMKRMNNDLKEKRPIIHSNYFW